MKKGLLSRPSAKPLVTATAFKEKQLENYYWKIYNKFGWAAAADGRSKWVLRIKNGKNNKSSHIRTL